MGAVAKGPTRLKLEPRPWRWQEALRGPACFSCPLPAPLGRLPPPEAPPGCQPVTLPRGRGWRVPPASPRAHLAKPAPHTGAISYSCFGSGVGGGEGRQGQTGASLHPYPQPQPHQPCSESTRGTPAAPRQCQHPPNPSTQGRMCPRGHGRFLVCLLPFPSLQAWAAPPNTCPPVPIPPPSPTALVLLRKASPAIMFSTHFLRLLGPREVASVTPLPRHCTDFDSFLH